MVSTRQGTVSTATFEEHVGRTSNKENKPYSSMQVQWPGIANISGQQQLPKNVKDAPVTPWYTPQAQSGDKQLLFGATSSLKKQRKTYY